jgi:serine/threonine-protein kinase
MSGSGGGSNSGAGGGNPGSGGAATQAQGRFLHKDSVWYQDISKAPVASDSAAITKWMVSHQAPNGWGTGKMKVDFSIVAMNVPPATKKRSYQTVPGFYYVPDCDIAPVPVPPGGAVEETWGFPVDLSGPFTGYACASFADGGDCHMLFYAPWEKRLYEIFHGNIAKNGAFHAGCLAIWDTEKLYDANGRGQQCTSADAAGFPIAPLLFTVEEIKAGAIEHAIRFALPNDMIRAKKYVSPATHGTGTTGPKTSIPYGARLRLRADYPLASLSPAARIVAKAMQKYGMLHADGGQIALMAQSDILSPVKWADVAFDSTSLSALAASDFEVLAYGKEYDVTYDCKRTQLTQ